MHQHMRNVGVDAFDERLCDGLRIGRRIGGPFRRHVAAIQEQSRSAILFDVTGSKILRQQTQATLAP